MKAEEKRQRRLQRKSGKSAPASIAISPVEVENENLVVTDSSAAIQLLINQNSLTPDIT